MERSPSPSPVPAATGAVRVLRFLAAQRGPVSAAVMGRELGLARSSLYHLLTALADEGFVVHLPEQRRYALGVAAFELSSGYLRQAPLARLGAPLLAALVDRSGESGHLAVLQGRDVVYVVEERAAHRPPLLSEVGVRLPSHLTASGRAMLAALEPVQIRALFPDAAAFAARDGAGPRTPRELRGVLDATRRRGYAEEDGEITPGLGSVAVCVTDAAGWPTASVAITFRTDDIPRADWPELAARIRPVAGELQRRMTGQRATLR